MPIRLRDYVGIRPLHLSQISDRLLGHACLPSISIRLSPITPRAIAYTVVQVGFEHPDNLLVLTQHLLGSLRPLVHARMGLNGRRLWLCGLLLGNRSTFWWQGMYWYPTLLWQVSFASTLSPFYQLDVTSSSEVFGASSTLATHTEVNEVPAPSSLQALKAARAAKRARNTHTIT